MNTRRIHIANIIDKTHIKINDKLIYVDDSVIEVASQMGNYTAFKFARRPFSGANRIIFIRYYSDFMSEDDTVYICSKEAHSLLAVGMKTTKFSIWFKPI